MKSDEFYKVWGKISDQLNPNGVVIVRLFGEKLNWPNMNYMTLLNKTQIDNLTKNFEVIKMEEEFQKDNQLK